MSILIQDKINEVKNKAHSILEDKTTRINEIDKKINDLSIELSEHHSMLAKAMDETNEKDFKKESRKISELEDTLLMYHTKKEQLSRNEFITEKESDAVIDNLLELQEENAIDYSKEIETHLHAILDISREYYKNMLDIESLITLWCNQVHANYNSRGKVVINGSTRLPYPTPVRTVSYQGCKEFSIIEDTLKKLSLTRAGVGLVRDESNNTRFLGRGEHNGYTATLK